MTQATTTALGEIKLAGDLAGSTDAALPGLTTVNSAPGSTLLPNITVDAKGRVTAATTAAPSQIAALIPDATRSVKGVVRIGDNISITDTAVAGYQIVNFGGTLNPSDFSALCDNGSRYSFKLALNGNAAVEYLIEGTALTTISELITTINGAISPAVISLVGGNLQISSNLTGSISSVQISDDRLFQFMVGYVGLNTPVPGMGESTIFVENATSSTRGVASFGSGFVVTGSSVSLAPIPDATTSSKGLVQVGSGLSASGGVVSAVPIPDATTSSKGLVQVGDGINVSSGVISVPTASTTVKGLVRVGANLEQTGGVLTTEFGDASTTEHGLVQIGSGIQVSSGTISVPLSTPSVAGIASIGTGLQVDAAGEVSLQSPLPLASTTQFGVVQAGSGVNVNSGILSIADATTSAKGVVQVGSGLAVSGGVISANIPDASSSVKGLVQIGSGLSVSSGVVSLDVPLASETVPGLVQIGSGLTIDGSGVVSVIPIPDASTTVKGLMRVGSGLSVTDGLVSTSPATNSTPGVVSSGNTSNITISSGLINVGTNIPKKDQANVYTRAQAVALVEPSFSTSVTPDFSQGNVFFYTATSNFTLNSPTNVIAGGTYIIIIRQDATGNRTCTFNSSYVFPFGAISSLSVSPSSYDVIAITAISTSVLLTTMQRGF